MNLSFIKHGMSLLRCCPLDSGHLGALLFYYEKHIVALPLLAARTIATLTYF